MARCKYCKMGIEWKSVTRKRPKKTFKEIDGILQMVYDQFRWQAYNPDGTEHRCLH